MKNKGFTLTCTLKNQVPIHSNLQNNHLNFAGHVKRLARCLRVSFAVTVFTTSVIF